MRSCSGILLRARIIAFHTPAVVVVDGVAVAVAVVVVVVCCLVFVLVARASTRVVPHMCVLKDSIMVGATTEAGKGESHFQRNDTTDLVIRSKANRF